MAEVLDVSVMAPHVRKHVEVVLKKSIGLCRKEVLVMNPRSSSSAAAPCDRFLLVIPYAGTPVECMVVFQSSAPDCPPDFIFSDSRFFVPLNEIDSFTSWDVHKADGLFQTLREIMQVYKKKQIQELERYEHLSFEYLCLYQLQDFNEDDIEIYVPSDPEGAVLFLIRLHVNLRCYFPDFYEEESDVEEFPLLFVTFPNRDSSRSYQRLYISKELETVLGVEETLELPEDVTDHYLTRYVITLEDDLKSKAEQAASRYERRKMYFVKFLSHFDTSVLEYDVLYYTSLVLLLREEDFFLIVEINLPDDFPVGTPALIFRSIYHTFMGEPVAVAIDSYPYSSSWSMHQVFEETVKFIDEYVPLFRQDSSPYCS